MALLGFLAGGLLATLLVSRLIFLAMRSWDGGYPKAILGNLFSWITASLIAGIGMADGGPFAGSKAAILYGIPQLVWLVVDLLREFFRRRREESAV